MHCAICPLNLPTILCQFMKTSVSIILAFECLPVSYWDVYEARYSVAKQGCILALLASFFL